MPHDISLTDQIIGRVIAFFIKSGDFNGIPIGTLLADQEAQNDEVLSILNGLVRDGRVELMFASHSDNPHIKRIAALPVEEQIKKLSEEDPNSVCAYPSAALLKVAVDVSRYEDRPYTKGLVLAEPQLTPVFFELSVLERYFEDPRYAFEFNDRSGSISVGREHYQSGSLQTRDEIFLQTFGIGYDEQRRRVVVVFLRYLANLSPEHQQIWRAHEVQGPCKMNSDYERAAIWGQWPQYYSVYEAFISEQVEINKLAELVGRPPMWKTTYQDGRPVGLQPMLRPTRKNFHAFVQVLDKMLSENINRDFFRGDIPREDRISAADGSIERRPLGSLTLLERWLKKMYRTADGEDISKQVVAPMKRIRGLRNKPSHALGENEYIPELTKEQDELLGTAIRGLTELRLILWSHPLARERYLPPSWLDSDKIVFY